MELRILELAVFFLFILVFFLLWAVSGLRVDIGTLIKRLDNVWRVLNGGPNQGQSAKYNACKQPTEKS